MSEAIGSACTSGCDSRLERRAEIDRADRQRQEDIRAADLEARRVEEADRAQAAAFSGSLSAQAVKAARASEPASHPSRDPQGRGAIVDITV